MSGRSPDERIEQLLKEVDEIRELNTGDPADHNDPKLIEWQRRAQAAVGDKLGTDSDLYAEIRSRRFWSFTSVYEDPTPSQLRGYFDTDLNKAAGALRAALESRPRPHVRGAALVEVHQEGASAQATAVATLHVTADQLRQLLAGAPELSAEEKGKAVAAVTDDTEAPSLEKVDRLLSIATRSTTLLKPILGWILTHADDIQF